MTIKDLHGTPVLSMTLGVYGAPQVGEAASVVMAQSGAGIGLMASDGLR